MNAGAMHIFQYSQHVRGRIALIHKIEHALVGRLKAKENGFQTAFSQLAAKLLGESGLQPQVSVIAYLHIPLKNLIGHLIEQGRMNGVVNKLKIVNAIPALHIFKMGKHLFGLACNIAFVIAIAAKGALPPVTASGKLIRELGVYILVQRQVGKIRLVQIAHAFELILRIVLQHPVLIKIN